MPFTPTDISGCKLWLAANALTGLSDGDPVGSWPDASGQGNDGSVQAGSFRPKYKTGIANSLPIVRFDGTQTFTMTFADFMSGFSSGSVFIVQRTTGASESVTHWGTNGDTDYYTFGDGNIYIGDGSTARKSCGAPITPLTDFHLLEVLSAGGARDCYLNQVSQFSTGSNTVGFVASPSLGRNTYAGDIAEVIVYDSALGSTDRASVENYLGAKYGLGFGGGGGNTDTPLPARVFRSADPDFLPYPRALIGRPPPDNLTRQQPVGTVRLFSQEPDRPFPGGVSARTGPAQPLSPQQPPGLVRIAAAENAPPFPGWALARPSPPPNLTPQQQPGHITLAFPENAPFFAGATLTGRAPTLPIATTTPPEASVFASEPPPFWPGRVITEGPAIAPLTQQQRPGVITIARTEERQPEAGRTATLPPPQFFASQQPGRVLIAFAESIRPEAGYTISWHGTDTVTVPPVPPIPPIPPVPPHVPTAFGGVFRRADVGRVFRRADTGRVFRRA